MESEAGVPGSHRDSEAVLSGDTAAVAISRAVAVDSVFKGASTAVLGYGLSFSAGVLGAVLGVSPLITIGASAVIIGLGLSWAGRGAKHLLRYGSRGSALAFLPAAGLGGAILAAVCTRALLELTANTLLSGLNQIAMSASGLFTAALLIQVLVMIFRWMLPDSEADTDDVSGQSMGTS